MDLILQRIKKTNQYTQGQLSIDGEFFCFTLEDVVREQVGKPVKEWKIPKETAIPAGLYEVVLQTSPRFGPETPTLLKVPGFTDVRIHGGNTVADTDGCIILGYRINDVGVIVPGTSRPAVNDFKQRVRKASQISLLVF